MSNLRSQTATEYLIILSVVIIIALIVISTLGGIPGIGGGAADSTNNAKLRTGDIGIYEYAITTNNTVITLLNNKNSLVSVEAIAINGTNCTGTPSLPFSLNPGGKRVVTCSNIYGSSFNVKYSLDVVITYRDLATNAQYTFAAGKLVGVYGGGSTTASETTELSISSSSISDIKSTFTITNNVGVTITIKNISLNSQMCWVPSTNVSVDGLPLNLTSLASVGLSCNTFALNQSQSYNYPLQINYSYTNGTNASINLTLSGTSTVSCPIGYIGVPGATLLEGTTVSDFCVMKYEAKALNTSTLVVDLDGMRLADGSQWTTLFLSDISARSLADGQPMRAINYTDARFECQELGSGYDLISDYQWMVVAENILRMPINDIDSSANTQLATGYARIGPSTPLSTTSSNDPSISGCDVWQSLGSISNAFTSTCQLRGNVSTFGYNGTATNFSISYGANTIGKSQLRTHVISNGNVLWDFAGNVYEIVRNVTPSGQISYPGASYYQFVTNYPISSGSAEYYDSDDNYLADAPLTLFNSWMAPTASSSTQGLGSINLLVYNSSERQIVRGGAYGTGIGGIFGVSSGLQLYLYAMDRGFRCVYTP